MDDTRLAVLGQFTPEGTLTPGYGDHYLFLVGRDDIHGILTTLIKAETLELDGNEFGYDDEEINAMILDLFKRPSVRVQITLDKSQSGGVHEARLIKADLEQDAVDFNNSFAIGMSATHRISHTKGMVFLGQGLWCEGSTNLSSDGEGVGISLKSNVGNPAGFAAQNNTLVVSANPVGLHRFKAKLDAEHTIAKAQMMASKSVTVTPSPDALEVNANGANAAARPFYPGDSVTDPAVLQTDEEDADTNKQMEGG